MFKYLKDNYQQIAIEMPFIGISFQLRVYTSRTLSRIIRPRPGIEMSDLALAATVLAAAKEVYRVSLINSIT